MWLPAIVSQFVNNKLTVIVEESLNIEHIKTMYGENFKHIFARIEIVDPRRARPTQRKLFFALLNDIQAWSGAPMKDFLKDYFYTAYSIENDGAEISLADNTKNSVSDANKLLDIVVDFMFSWNVPFKQGYELLPRDENYFLYQCCKHRKCVICGKHADIHHIETIGIGGNRLKVDHTKRHVMAVCRRHHGELEQIGSTKFSAKYKLPVNGIKLDVETLKKIALREIIERRNSMTVRKVTKQDRKFQGVWIPAKYWLDEELKIIEVVFLTEINSLDNDQGCFASNKYFSEFFGLTAGRCSQIINGLVDKGYLSVKYDREGKQIKKRTLRIVNKLNTPIKNIKGGYLENAEGNNTSINNTKRSSSSKGAPDIFTEYQMTGATLSNNNMLVLMDYEQRLGDELVLHAIAYMDEHATKPNFNYLRQTLDGYETGNVSTVEKAKEIEKSWVEKNKARSNNYQHSFGRASTASQPKQDLGW